MDHLKACIGISPTYDLNFREIHSLVKASAHSPEPLRPTCVVFTLEDGRNSLFKLLRILSTFAKIRLLSFFLYRKCRFVTKAYGIYPTAKQPLVIFEMRSHAEVYAMANILPEAPSGLNGYLRLVVTRLTKINPLLGGVAIVIQENT